MGKFKSKHSAKSCDNKNNVLLKSKGGQPGNDNARKWTEEKALEIANGLIEWLKIENNILFEEYLVMEHGLYKEIVSYLCGQYDSFFNIIKKAKEMQEIKLQKSGLLGQIDKTLTIFLLKNHHSYSDKKEVEVKEMYPPLYRGVPVSTKNEVSND